MRQHPNRRVLDGERAGDGEAVVGRSVVDDDDVHLDAVLRERARDRVGEEPPVVEAGNDDRDGRAIRRGERVRTYPQPFPYAGQWAGGAEVA